MLMKQLNQPSNVKFGDFKFRLAPSSSSSSSSSDSKTYYSKGSSSYSHYNNGIDPLTFMLLSGHQNTITTPVMPPKYEDIRKAEVEAAKDDLFLREHPEIIKREHPVLKGITAGTLVGVLTTFATKGIEIIKENKDTIAQYRPEGIALGVLCGLAVGVLTKAVAMPSGRRERLIHEEKETKAQES